MAARMPQPTVEKLLCADGGSAAAAAHFFFLNTVFYAAQPK
jgi:hypothetical protein